MFGAPILALDQGTSSSRALLYAGRGTPKIASRALGFDAPHEGFVEQDAEEIWRTILESAEEVLDNHEGSVAALGITNQRETTLLWERKGGRVIAPAIVWQDRRTESHCATLRAEGLAEMVAAKTGLLIDSYFSATKLQWLLDNVEGAREKAKRGELAFGTVESFLIYRLTEGRVHASDATNASRTMLYDIHRACWDEDLLKIFDIPPQLLPEIRENAADFGSTKLLARGRSIPIRGSVGDQQGAAIGQNCIHKGLAKSTYGTGCFLLSHRGEEAPLVSEGLLATTAFHLEGKSAYALEGSIFMAGALVQWLRDRLGFIESAEEVEALARQSSHDDGVYFVPAFTGLGAPYWDGQARGSLYGMTQRTGARRDCARLFRIGRLPNMRPPLCDGRRGKPSIFARGWRHGAE